MKTNLRLLCGVLLTAFTLSGCAEQILDSASNEPAPSVTSGEESAANTIAKFSTAEGLAPQPSDVVLANVNAALPAESQLQGVSRLMPVRIPFSAPLASLYDEDGNWNALAGSNLAQNLLILNLTDSNAALILPMPTGGGGNFKVVYQDANHELVLVPEADTFQAGTMYAVAVKTSLGDAQGNNISPDALTNILTNPSPIVVDGKIVNTLFDDLDTANGLEGLRTSYAPLVGTLQALGQIETHNDLAQLFTFTTEPEDPVVTAGTAALLSAVQANLTNTLSASLDNVSWATSYPSDATLGDQPVDLKEAVLASLTSPDAKILKDDVAVANIPTDSVSKLYKGYFSCRNFLAQTANGWELDLLNRATTPGKDCPNSNPALNGKIGFWLVMPSTVDGIVIFSHGITDVKEDAFTVMNTLASKNFVTVVIDTWGHGERSYEDVNGNGDLTDDVRAAFMRFDNPALSVGYFLQTQFDLFHLRTLLEANPKIFGTVGNIPTVTPIHFFGWSGAGMIGSNLIGSNFPAERFVLNNPGGDLADIVLSGDYGPEIRTSVALSYGLDTSTQDGKETLNSTLLGLELTNAHAFFKGGIDPLLNASSSNSAKILFQQVTGDPTVPNSNTDLLSLAQGLATYKDGDGALDNTTRSRWILDPSNYQSTTGDTALAVHRFLVDWKTEATLRGQQQAVCFLATGKVLDPSKEINITTCTNVN